MNAFRTIATLSLSATLLACSTASAFGPGRAALEVTTHTAGEAGFSVNSHLIAGRREAILVDAQFTRSEAAKVVDLVKASGKELTTIFVTHGHPDHYLGLEVLTREFPLAKVLATPAVIAEIQATAPGKIAYWKPMYGDDLAGTFVTPTAFTGKTLTLEGQEIQVVELKDGESESAAALYVPSTRTLVAGDLAYGDVHLWLAEGRPEGWLAQLAALQGGYAIDRVLSGHGVSGDASLLETNAAYIREFVAATAPGTTAAAALAQLKATYATYLLPIIAEISVGARIK